MSIGTRRFGGGLVVGAGIVAAALLLGQSRAEVAWAQYGEYGGGTPVNVNAARCILFRGGRESVPAGSLVVITGGWLSGTPGAVRSFLQAQTTIVSAGDGRMVDASGEYGPVTNQPDGTSITRFSHSTGIVLGGPGSVMRFTFTQILSRPVVDVFDYDGDGRPDPTLGDAGLSFGGTCVVTVV